MHSVLFTTTVVIQTIVRAVRDDKGSTAMEYGMIIAVLVIAMMVGLTAFAHTTTDIWNMVDARVAAAR